MNGTWLSVSLNNTFINDYEVTWLQYNGRLSSPEGVRLKILSSLPLAEVNQALNSPMNVVIQNAEQAWTLNLMVFKVEALLAEELMDRNCYMLELYSPVFDLSRNHITPVLKKISISGACETLLSGQFINARLTELQNYRMNISNCDVDHPLPLVKGLNESLLAFWQRLLSIYGLSYAFDQTDSGMMVISDNLAQFAPSVEIMQNTYASGDLLTDPHYEQAQKVQKMSSADVLTAGHPRAAPETLLASNSTSQFKGLPYQADFNEFNESEADLHAQLLYQAKQGEANRNYYIGGGIVFPGMLDTTRQELIVATQFTLEFDAHEQNRVRAIPLAVISQPIAFSYHDRPILLENHSMLFHGGTISDVTGNPSESVSVSSEGHYHVLLPEFVTDNLSSAPVVDTRMVYPMQSDDHSQHFTLMNNSEGLLLYDATPLGESLLLGTGNSGMATHITNQDTAQNQYWQDASQNKQAFINEGTYDPSQKTGRATAQIMEAPNYHPDGSSSYMRMGDPIQNDSSYPSQAGESGLFMATTGHYQEEHQGGLLHMSGNTGTDPNNPVPVNREMTQLNPVGTPNILQSSTANLHNNLMTTSTVTQTSELTAGTLTETLTSPSLFNSWTADNTNQIFVNQDLQQIGDTTNLTLNNQNTMLTTPANNITQVGTQRTDQITTATLTQNHTNNVFQYQTWQKSTTTGQEQITTQNLNVPNLTRNTQTGTVQAANFNTTASSFSAATSTTYISSLVMDGSASGSGPSPLMQAQQATLANQNQQQANQKIQIAFKLDDPNNLVQNVPQLSVNGQNPMPLTKNGVAIYPLSSEQKEGPTNFEIVGPNSETSTILVNEQMRLLGVQDPSTQTQPYKPYFTPKQTLPGYAGFQTVPGAMGIDVNDADINVIMLAATAAPPLAYQSAGGYEVSSVTDDMVTWIMQAIYSVNKVLPKLVSDDSGNVTEQTGWHWEMPSLSDYGLLFKDGTNALAIKDNRKFIVEFFHSGKFAVKEVKGQWMLVFKGQAGLRDWVTGTTYSIEGDSKNKVRIFKNYAKLMTNEGKFTKAAVLAEDAADDSPLAFVIIAPLDTVQYFFLDKDPNKQISDLFVNIGIDVANAAVAGALVMSLAILLAPFIIAGTVAAGFVVIAGIVLAFAIGNLLKNVENNTGITNALIQLGRKAEDHFIAEGDQLKIDFETFSNESATALTRLEAANNIATTAANTTTKIL